MAGTEPQFSQEARKKGFKLGKNKGIRMQTTVYVCQRRLATMNQLGPTALSFQIRCH